MPVYQWECPLCEKQAETVATIAERNKNVPTCCGTRMARVISPHYAVPDIAPYQAVAGDMAGKHITSRREHREFLKRNGFVEVGNEWNKPEKVKRPTLSLPPMAPDVARATREVLAKYRR